MTFAETLRSGGAVLAEGAVIERLRRNPATLLDPAVAHAGFIYDSSRREALESIFRGYLGIACEYALPIVCFTPTWRASLERVDRSPFRGRDLNGDAVRFMRGLMEGSGCRAFLGGLIGCRGDAYQPGEALGVEEAARYHAPQLSALAAAGVDFLCAETLPAASEAIGIAQAMARLGAPYVISFLIDGDGMLLDGVPVADVIARIDEAPPAPLAYMVNCVHPRVLRSALERRPAQRVVGVQANTSALSPAELDGMAELETEEPQVLAASLLALRRDFGLQILGGCCGTDDRHIRALAALLSRPEQPPDDAPSAQQ